MIRLRTLGRIDLRADGGAPVSEALAQPKRLALLTYLATQAGEFCRRDTLVALLWPELDSDRARHSLRQSVYRLRQWLGQAVIVGRGEEELGVDLSQLWCDCVAFRQLADQGRLEESLALYGGDFLAGFHPPEASEEFEDWIAATRSEHRTAATRIAMTLARNATGAGDLERALEWARWAAATDPLQEGIQTELIRVLVQKGDKVGAERAYKAFAERLHRELGSAPSAATRKALTDTASVTPLVSPALPVEIPLSATAATPASASPAVALQRPRSRTLTWVSALASLAILVGATYAFLQPGGSKVPILAVGTIHQDLRGGDSSSWLPIGDLLSTSVAELPGVQVLSNARLIEIDQALRSQGRTPNAAEVARRAQATQLLEGSLFRREGDSLVLELRRVDLVSGRVLRGYRVGARDVFTLVDRATAAIAQEAEVQQPPRSIADVTTKSLVAYRLFEAGLRTYYLGDYVPARRLLETAVGEDSAFAMAMFYLARTEQSQQLPAANDHFLAALRLASGASDRERLLMTAHVFTGDSRSTGLALAESLTTRYPNDPEALWVLGSAQASAGRVDQAVRTLRRTIALDSAVPLSDARGCRPCDSYLTLVDTYAWADSLPRALAVAHEFTQRWPRTFASWSSLAQVAYIMGDTVMMDSAKRASERLVGHPQGPGINAPLLRQIARGNYLAADRELLSLGSLSEDLRSELRWYLSISLRNQGRLREAVALSRDGTLPQGGELTRWRMGPDSQLLAIARLEAGEVETCRAWYRRLAQVEREDLQGWPGQQSRERTWALGRLAMCRAAVNDTVGFEGLADSVEAIGSTLLWNRDRRLHHYVRGMLWKARGNFAQAAQEFSAALSSPNFGFTRINYELADMLLKLGRPKQAVAVLQPALRGALDASNLYLTRTEIHERLAQAWAAAGNPDSARVHWEAVESAWRRADPAFVARYHVAVANVPQTGQR